MKSTIKTEAGAIVIEASPGRITTNGVALLPHEAQLVAAELVRAAQRAQLAALDHVIPRQEA